MMAFGWVVLLGCHGWDVCYREVLVVDGVKGANSYYNCQTEVSCRTINKCVPAYIGIFAEL